MIRKILFVITSIMLVFSLCACDLLEDTPDNDEPSSEDGGAGEETPGDSTGEGPGEAETPDSEAPDTGTDGGKDEDDGGNTKPSTPSTPAIPENTIYGSGVVPVIVVNSTYTDAIDTAIRNLSKTVSKSSMYWPFLYTDATAAKENEMVFGDTSRPISALAKAALEEKIESECDSMIEAGTAKEDIAGYVIYSDGKSVGVYWSHFQIATDAIEYFEKNYAHLSHLVLEPGYTKTHLLSITEYLEEREARILEEKWAALAVQIPEQYREDIVKELKNIYDFYGEDMITWLANLYDPATGGWYHSNSARDDTSGINITTTSGTVRVQYLPDIENTYVALSLVSATGMAEMLDGSWTKAMPEWLLEDVGNWVQSLQNEDTFFYHPQWPKEFIEKNNLQSRITRDRGSAKSLLRSIGVPILYTSYSASGSELADRFTDREAAVAVSKAVYAATMLWQYESVENFERYIAGLEAEIAPLGDAERAWKFYYYGNNFQSTTNYINADTTGQMKRMLIEFFEKYQNPTTGMWSEGLYYDSANGVHKIASVFNSLGQELKYTDKIIDSTLAILNFDPVTRPASGGVNIYNTWSCLPYGSTNIRHDASGTLEEREARCTEIKNLVYAGAAEAIHNSFLHIEGMKQADGSFGYSRSGSSSTAQGCPAAVPGTREGDVNGNALCTYDIVHYITLALELEQFEIPMFTEEDRYQFVKIITANREKLHAEVGEDTTYSFTNEEVGTVPEGFTVAIDTGRNEIPGSKIEVAEELGNRALAFTMRSRGNDTNGRNYSVTIPVTSLDEYSTRTRLEFSVMIKSSTSVGANILEITVGRATDGACTILPRIGRASDGTLSIYDTASKKIGDIGRVDEFIDIVIDYRFADKTYDVYADGVYVGSSSANYSKNAHTMAGKVTFGTASTVSADYLIDDVRFINYKPTN